MALALLAVSALAGVERVPARVDLPDSAWRAEVVFGRDLFANWCDDVLEPGEPEPVRQEHWPIVDGAIELRPVGGDCIERRARLEGLLARRPDGAAVRLPDRDVRNGGWGCVAG